MEKKLLSLCGWRNIALNPNKKCLFSRIMPDLSAVKIAKSVYSWHTRTSSIFWDTMHYLVQRKSCHICLEEMLIEKLHIETTNQQRKTLELVSLMYF
jgi:hypothetical protein